MAAGSCIKLVVMLSSKPGRVVHMHGPWLLCSSVTALAADRSHASDIIAHPPWPLQMAWALQKGPT